MSKTKKVLCLVAASIALGGILGTLYAPAEGSETRRKLTRLKRKFSCCNDGEYDDDRESLHELKTILEQELKKINDKIDKLG